jgi:hypothetical protein
MNLGPDVDLEDCEAKVETRGKGRVLIRVDSADVSRPDRLSSAEIAAICQAAGLQGMLFTALPSSRLDPYYTAVYLEIQAVRKNRYGQFCIV